MILVELYKLNNGNNKCNIHTEHNSYACCKDHGETYGFSSIGYNSKHLQASIRDKNTTRSGIAVTLKRNVIVEQLASKRRSNTVYIEINIFVKLILP